MVGERTAVPGGREAVKAKVEKGDLGENAQGPGPGAEGGVRSDEGPAGGVCVEEVVVGRDAKEVSQDLGMGVGSRGEKMGSHGTVQPARVPASKSWSKRRLEAARISIGAGWN